MSSPFPHGSPLANLASGAPFESLEAARDDLRGLMVDFERALDEAEGRERRIARRRGTYPTADQVGRGRGGAA